MHGGNVWQGGAPGDWLDFSANIRPEGPPEWVRTALADALCEVSYYPDLAMRRAREGLAAYLGLDPARVLPTAGGIAAVNRRLLPALLMQTDVIAVSPGLSLEEAFLAHTGL